jgi:alpha-glucosidase
MLLLLTLRGTPTLYYGDELGLENVPIPREQVRDRFGLKDAAQGRDPERTPMPWDTSPNAGFTSGEPWLPLGRNHPAICVEVQQRDRSSMLSLTQALLALRHREPALSLGDWAPLAVKGDVLAYTRTWAGTRFVVALNLEPAPKVARFDADLSGRIELSTHPGRAGEPVSDRVSLSGDEAVIIRMDPRVSA